MSQKNEKEKAPGDPGLLPLSHKLSDHLTVGEIQCKCGCGYGRSEGDISPEIVAIFEQIRKQLRKAIGQETPLIISSGCRCRQHNRAIGGAKKSRHLVCDALDIRKPNAIDYDTFYEICDQAVGDKGGVGKYKSKSFVHVDARGYYQRWLS